MKIGLTIILILAITIDRIVTYLHLRTGLVREKNKIMKWLQDNFPPFVVAIFKHNFALLIVIGLYWLFSYMEFGDMIFCISLSIQSIAFIYVIVKNIILYNKLKKGRG